MKSHLLILSIACENFKLTKALFPHLFGLQRYNLVVVTLSREPWMNF